MAISRAIVRDLFTHDRSARIMNLIGLILGVGPAFSPTIGGLLMGAFGWKSIFVFMALAAIVVTVVLRIFLVETVKPDPTRIRPLALVRSYREIAGSGYFVFSGLVIGGASGAIYTQATVLPFVLMTRVGLTPTQFGLGMLFQSGGFFIGSIVVRRMMRNIPANRLVPIGLCFIFLGSLALAVGLRLFDPTFLGVMVPVFVFTFGLAFVMPAMQTAGVAPFPHIAGAASSMAGFIQMGSGLVGGLLSAWLGDPVGAMSTIIPCMGLIAVLSWLFWRTLPEPALARIVLTPEETKV